MGRSGGNVARQWKIKILANETNFVNIFKIHILRRFHQRRLRETKEALLSYTEAQIRNSQLSVDEMRQCVAKMRDYPLPQRSTDFLDGDEDDRKYN